MREGQFWRFFTPIFIHVGVFHLSLNLLSQLPIGIDLERCIGTWRVVFVYFISGKG